MCLVQRVEAAHPETSACCALQSIFVDDEGYILQGPTENIAVIADDPSVLLVPPFEEVPAGLTLQRLMKMMPEVRGCGY